MPDPQENFTHDTDAGGSGPTVKVFTLQTAEKLDEINDKLAVDQEFSFVRATILDNASNDTFLNFIDTNISTEYKISWEVSNGTINFVISDLQVNFAKQRVSFKAKCTEMTFIAEEPEEPDETSETAEDSGSEEAETTDVVEKPTLEHFSIEITYEKRADTDYYKYGQFNTLNETNVFDKFEPYHCNNEAFDSNLFGGTAKYQKGINNNFSNILSVSSFTAAGERITGYEIGTVPKAGTGHLITSGQCDVAIWLDANNTLHIKPEGIYYTQPEQTYNIDTLKTYGGGNNGIKRLGIALVGAGGAVGECKQIKIDYSSAEWTAHLPGGGGGGGGILWGVLFLDKTDDAHAFHVSIGTHAIKAGKSGGTTYLRYYPTSLASTVGNTTTWFTIDGTTAEYYGVLATAYGGNGGDAGKKDSKTKGGAGGKTNYVNNNTAKSYFYQCDHADGGNGTGYSYPDEEGYPGDSCAIDVAFFAAKEDGGTFTTTINSSAPIFAVDYEKMKSKDENDYRQSVYTSGGNSWGIGAYGSNDGGNVPETDPGVGGGGGGNGGNSTAPYSNDGYANSPHFGGGNGGWFIFY